MLTLRVTSYNGAVPERPLEARFEAAGGTIGRADDNDLALPDSTRHISRVHARVIFVSGAFELVDEGANAIDVNGSPLGPGQKARLHDGDRLRIGSYMVSVTIDQADAAPQSRGDPFAAFGGSLPADPLGLGFGQASSSVPQPTPVTRRASPAGGIPEDFDPFAHRSIARAAAASSRLPDDLDLGLGGLGGNAPSIDAMFGLGSASGVDPFAEGALAQPVSPGRVPATDSVDPLAAFGAPPAPAAAAPVPDQVPEVRGMFRMPVAESGPRSATPAAEQPPGDTFLSWEDDAPPAIAPRRETSAETPMASVPPDEVTHVRPVNRPPPPGAASAPPFVASPAGSPAVGPAAVAGDELARAFADGLGLDRPPLASLTPEAMVQIGRLLREATQGTLDLLMARALTKREVRAEGTMIVGKDNNPLKFSPSVEAALAHLLAPQGRGFLPPIEAMRDAYDDLRSHQFGFMAGLRAALAGVLKRFDPSVLEQRIAHKTVFDSVLPINRRAKLWDLYEHLYREIAREAEDDFHTLFGREFLRAYEEQVARLEDSRGSADPPVPPAPGPRR